MRTAFLPSLSSITQGRMGAREAALILMKNSHFDRTPQYLLCRARVTKDRQKFCVNDKKNIRIQIIVSPFRYNAIIRPLKPRMGRPMTILVAIGIWLVAMTIAVPQLLYFRTIGANDPLLNPGSLDPFDLSVPNITGNNQP